MLLINLGDEDFVIERGMRIAQMVIAPVDPGKWRARSPKRRATRPRRRRLRLDRGLRADA